VIAVSLEQAMDIVRKKHAGAVLSSGKLNRNLTKIYQRR
jgi:hypothetical protein